MTNTTALVRISISRPAYHPAPGAKGKKGLSITLDVPDEIAEDEHTMQTVYSHVRQYLDAHLKGGVFRGTSIHKLVD